VSTDILEFEHVRNGRLKNERHPNETKTNQKQEDAILFSARLSVAHRNVKKSADALFFVLTHNNYFPTHNLFIAARLF
jgi:hypothetical protein